MKKLVICMLLLGMVSVGHTQILLKEATVISDPASLKLDPYSNSLTIQMSEDRVGEFGENPLMFLKNHFDFQSFANQNRGNNFDNYQIWFKSTKGYLLANVDKDGNLLSSSQRFKNVMLPKEDRDKILADYGKVKFTSSKYFASSKGWDIDRAYYRVKISDGKKTTRVRIDVPHSKASIAGL